MRYLPLLLHVLGLMKSSFYLVFAKTRILGVKVNTLVCFLSMVKTLDQVCRLYPDGEWDSLIRGMDELDVEVGTVISQGVNEGCVSECGRLDGD